MTSLHVMYPCIITIVGGASVALAAGEVADKRDSNACAARFGGRRCRRDADRCRHGVGCGRGCCGDAAARMKGAGRMMRQSRCSLVPAKFTCARPTTLSGRNPVVVDSSTWNCTGPMCSSRLHGISYSKKANYTILLPPSPPSSAAVSPTHRHWPGSSIFAPKEREKGQCHPGAKTISENRVYCLTTLSATRQIATVLSSDALASSPSGHPANAM